MALWAAGVEKRSTKSSVVSVAVPACRQPLLAAMGRGGVLIVAKPRRHDGAGVMR